MQTPWERMVADHETMNLTTGPHPMALLRQALPPTIRTSRDLRTDPTGSPVTIAGIVVARQRPGTAQGIVFLLLEDEHGMSNVIVYPDVYERDRIAVRAEPLLEITGRLERRDGTINVLADRIVPLGHPGRSQIGPAPVEVPDVGELRAAAPQANSFGRGRR
jgi:error-prone DNA polymerase